MDKALKALSGCLAQRPCKDIGADHVFHRRIAESLVEVGRTWRKIADAGLWNGEWFQRTYLLNWWYCCGGPPEAVGGARHLMQLAFDLEDSDSVIRPDYVQGLIPAEVPTFDRMRQHIEAFTKNLLGKTQPDKVATDWSTYPGWEELQSQPRRLLKHMADKDEDSHNNILEALETSADRAIANATSKANEWLDEINHRRRLSSPRGEGRLCWKDS
jgi:hypothetical protein